MNYLIVFEKLVHPIRSFVMADYQAPVPTPSFSSSMVQQKKIRYLQIKLPMGLSIHYSATIRNQSSIDRLIDETADVCQSMNWKYQIIKESGEEGVNGIVFSPENCEPVFLTFLLNGRMCSPISIQNKTLYAANGIDPELIYTTSTKTQYAGPDTHIALLKFLKYLKEKYFDTFEIDDEGYYWNTNDENILFQRFSHYNFLLNAVGKTLSDIKRIPGESASSLAERIEKVLKEKFGKENISD